MDQSFSRYAIASVSLALLVPVEFYANIHGITRQLAPNLILMIMIVTPLGAVILGHMARVQIRRSGYVRGGYATGSAGMILGYLCFATFSYLFLIVSMKPSLP